MNHQVQQHFLDLAKGASGVGASVCLCLNQSLMIKKINSCFQTVHTKVADIYSKTSKTPETQKNLCSRSSGRLEAVAFLMLSLLLQQAPSQVLFYVVTHYVSNAFSVLFCRCGSHAWEQGRLETRTRLWLRSPMRSSWLLLSQSGAQSMFGVRSCI